MSAAPVKEPSWHANLPLPRAKALNVSSAELHEMMKKGQTASTLDPLVQAEFLVVDVRRTDFEDYFIVGAVNLPAQSFHQTIPSLLPILTQFPLVIFHCSQSNGRGPRIASYYQDALDDRGITKSKAAVLVGGVKEWVEKFGRVDGGSLVCKL